ncbi:competence protein ComER [Aneurinibacillus soli]|uniref:Pyrroline-5-carboxylate reductase n=1 Tax=Aneurinibacillus soli TaxID=1500254 RepID=A0A0U5AYS1_9BACL|nr:late competence protein ComER [Aneurinibacillus soli]PYE62590.1 competence protein ComER [Aneurinibacillus soli]BAU27152.1 Pyrroline-5-carboxylate reductase [Aneurinibacillus soli]
MHIGFIGTGSMGTMLLEAFIESGAVAPDQIIASNRSSHKLDVLIQKHSGLHTGTNIHVAQKADVVFLCVKPLEYRAVLDEIQATLTPEKLILSITSSIGVKRLESYIPSKIARIIPSITNTAHSGASLVTFGSRLTPADRTSLLKLIATISTPIEIEEDHTRISSDITSCGPAFFSFLMQRYIDCAVEETGISEEQATEMMTAMVIGMGRLLEDGRYSLPSLQAKVCVPGGVTGIGLNVLDKETKDTFNHLVQATQRKFHTDLLEVQALFTDKKNPLH